MKPTLLRRIVAEFIGTLLLLAAIVGQPRLLMRGLSGAKVEIGLATMAYNLKRIDL
jgi:hypothetical protein